MKLLFCITLLQSFIISFGQQPLSFDFDSLMAARTSQIVGKPFSTFTAINEQGRINNDSLKGKVVLINFWFEGCHPCLAEFGALNELAEKLKGNKDFEFISFTWDNDETIKRVKEKYKLQFKVFYSKECERLNQNSGYPTSFILDRKGNVKYWNMGGTTDTDEAKEYVMTTLFPKIQQELLLP